MISIVIMCNWSFYKATAEVPAKLEKYIKHFHIDSHKAISETSSIRNHELITAYEISQRLCTDFLQ